jgi:hypothetical protein
LHGPRDRAAPGAARLEIGTLRTMDLPRRGGLGLFIVGVYLTSCQDPVQDAPGPLSGGDERDADVDAQSDPPGGIPTQGGEDEDPPMSPCEGMPALGEALPDDCEIQTEPTQPEPPGPPSPPDLPLFFEGSTTFVVLPDTQFYAARYPSIFSLQTSWIAQSAVEHNIAYVFHLGDIVNSNSTMEWKRASAAMAELDGLVPYGLVTGNHDYGPYGKATTRETLLNDWFSFDDVELMPSFGGAYQPGRLDNTYHLFDAGPHSWIAVLLEWAPRDEVVAWANSVMEQHPDRLGILVTHAYLNYNDHRLDHTINGQSPHNPHHYGTPGAVNDGEELWQKLVRRHRFVLTLSGHILGDGTGHLASVNDHGRVVHQILSNYQHREFGGEGFLRLLELMPDGRTMHVRTYSPLLEQRLTAPDQQFVIELDVD